VIIHGDCLDALLSEFAALVPHARWVEFAFYPDDEQFVVTARGGDPIAWRGEGKTRVEAVKDLLERAKV